MAEVLQKGNNVKVPASENRSLARNLLGFGAARKAGDEVATTRKSRLDEAEKRDVGYAKGGNVKAPSPASIRAYSKEYDTITPAGKNVHEATSPKRRFASGGQVNPLNTAKTDAAGGPSKTRRGYGKARGA